MVQTCNGGVANAFESDKPGTAARSEVEAAIEALRDRGGVFVDAVRATRTAMALVAPNLPGNPIVFANESFEKLSGYTLAEVRGQQPFFMNGPNTDPNDVDELRAALKEDQDGYLETIQYRKNGSRFVANVLLSAFKDDDGRTLYHFLSWQDVTRRERAERQLETIRQTDVRLLESEQRQAFLLDLSDRLRALDDPEEVQRAAMEALGKHLAVNRALYFDVQSDWSSRRPLARLARD